MSKAKIIDISFDVRTDAGGKDPDTHSATLRRYHRILWSKTLPTGGRFDLVEEGRFLHHKSTLGEFIISSDSVMQTFVRWASMKHITSTLPDAENLEFMRIAYTIGGMMVFPANKIDGKQTINGARGFNRSIADRFDLTLECIRRHYLGKASPLADVLGRYARFFQLFGDFRGYVEHFLLQDLVSDDCEHVEFFAPFDDFNSSAIPKSVESYVEFRRRSISLIEARNARIDCTVNRRESTTE